MTERIIIAGAGGQGIMLLGKVLAEAAMRLDKYVTWLPSYGAEVRGGTSHCMVIISDAQIPSSYIKEADALIVMNGPSLVKFKPRLKNNGLLIINSSLAKEEIGQQRNTHTLCHPFTDIALNLGNIKVANMVALGCFIPHTNTVDLKTLFEAIRAFASSDKKGLVEINKKALLEGMKLK